MNRHTFSIRIPEDLLIQISRRAQETGSADRNKTIIELLQLGLNEAQNFEEAVRRFVFREISSEDLKNMGAKS